ncbi:MAG: fatty acid desaturase [Candidatus Binatia bacterium]|nr:fatty acid desaturase [Candidatus Binatia bacterium]
MNGRQRPQFERRSDAVSLLVVAAHLAFVLCPVFLGAWVGVSPWLVPLWFWFGLAFHGMLNLWHESSHALVFQERARNEVLGRWVLAPLILGEFDTYKQRHWDHHRFVGEENDTKDAYLLDLHGSRVLGFLVRCLTLQEAIQKLKRTGDTSAATPPSSTWLARAAVVHGALFASLFFVALSNDRGPLLAFFAAGFAWGGIFIYGMAGLTLFVASLRTLCEHGVADDGTARVGRAALRNFACGPIERLLMGSYGFAEHATHHREPAVPSYRLREATAQLVEQGAAELRPCEGGYHARLREIVAG